MPSYSFLEPGQGPNYQWENDHTFVKVGAAETGGAYTLMDAELAYTFAGLGDTRNGDVTVYVKGSNLSDEEARVHSSFLKDLAPLPGRNISIGLRGSF